VRNLLYNIHQIEQQNCIAFQDKWVSWSYWGQWPHLYGKYVGTEMSELDICRLLIELICWHQPLAQRLR